MENEENLKYEIVSTYMFKDVLTAIKLCGNYINNKKGEVSDDFWELMFDLFYVNNDKVKFIQLSKIYSDVTGNVKAVWKDRDNFSVVSSKNLFFVDKNLNNDEDFCNKITKFYDDTVTRKFGRIDFNQLNLIGSNYYCLNLLLTTLYKFKELDDTDIILMGDNKILDFKISKYDLLKERAIEKEPNSIELISKNIDKLQEVVYLLKLELLQWKGYEDKYNELSIEYFDKYSMFPPDYNPSKVKSKIQIENNKLKNGVTTIENENQFSTNSIKNEILKFHSKEINSQNLNYLTEYLMGTNNDTIFIDFNNVDFFGVYAADELFVFFNSYRGNSHYNIYIKNANKMIRILFKMVGLTEYVSFIN